MFYVSFISHVLRTLVPRESFGSGSQLSEERQNPELNF